MGEGGDGQYDASVVPQEDPKDAMARKWAEQLKAAEKTSGQVIGELIAGGAEMVNYTATTEQGWNPTIKDGPRKMVLLTGNIYTGPRWGAEALKASLSFVGNVDASKSFGTESLCMVPYPRFDTNGGIDGPRSQVFVFKGQQVQDLQRLVGITPAVVPTPAPAPVGK